MARSGAVAFLEAHAQAHARDALARRVAQRKLQVEEPILRGEQLGVLQLDQARLAGRDRERCGCGTARCPATPAARGPSAAGRSPRRPHVPARRSSTRLPASSPSTVMSMSRIAASGGSGKRYSPSSAHSLGLRKVCATRVVATWPSMLTATRSSISSSATPRGAAGASSPIGGSTSGPCAVLQAVPPAQATLSTTPVGLPFSSSPPCPSCFASLSK